MLLLSIDIEHAIRYDRKCGDRLNIERICTIFLYNPNKMEFCEQIKSNEIQNVETDSRYDSENLSK